MSERHADIHFLPAIEKPTEDQVAYFLAQAAFYDDIFEQGGMTAEEAAFNRGLALGRIGMGQMFQHLPADSHPELPFDDQPA